MSHFLDMMEQVKKLKNGIGVQALLDEAYKILGNPIAMNNTEYTLQAYTEVETDDPIWKELIGLGTFGEITQRFFEKAGFIEEVANKRIAYLKTEYLKYDRINGKLFSKNNTHIANLVIIACNKPFEDGDEKLFEIICKIMSKEISEDTDIAKYEQEHQQMLVNNLIDGNYDKQMDIAQVEILYGTLDLNLYLVVVDVSHCVENTDLTQFIDLFARIKPEYKYATYHEYILMLASTNDDSLNVRKEFKELIEVFEQNDIYAGISRRFENLFELKKHYLEAVKSLAYVLECKCSQRIFPYDAGSIRAMEQIESLEPGLGIQYFLNKGLDIFGNPLLFHDMEPNLLGYTENVEILDPIWQELITYGTGSDDMVELFRTEGWVDTMDKTRGGALLVSDKCKYDRISWRIYNNDNIRFGCTSIVNTMKPFSEDELVLFGTFSQKFSDEVKKIALYDNIGQVYSRTIINRLLSGKIDGYTFYSEDVGNLYDDFMKNLHLVAVDTTHCKPEQVTLTYFRKLFSHMDTVNRYAFFFKYIIIIISMDTTLLNENNALDKLNAIFEQNNLYAGISRCFDDLYQLPRYYQEAVDALNAGMEKTERHGKHRIFQYDGTPHES